MKAEDIKVGGIYEIIGNKLNHQFEVGTLVKVTEIKHDYNPYSLVAYYLDDSDHWLVTPDDLGYTIQSATLKAIQITEQHG